MQRTLTFVSGMIDALNPVRVSQGVWLCDSWRPQIIENHLMMIASLERRQDRK